MKCYRKVTEDLYWIGGNDRRLSLFEGVYRVPDGVSYNAYLLLDEKTVLFDTVDLAVGEVFFENLRALLPDGRLDYVVVHHMEPDHSATLERLLELHPETRIICNAKTAGMFGQFFTLKAGARTDLVKERDTFCSGRHTLRFINAPMVHWPEVMMSFDETDGILFSADAFGTFGALNGAVFADETDFDREYMDEARRYYANIVGKYGTQVSMALKKAAALDIRMIAPLHGPVWRKDLGRILEKYKKWAAYEPEENSVLIAYASVYGHTAGAADILGCALRERGIRVKIMDVSVKSADYVIAEAFRCSHLVLASTTYNAGIFVRMEELLHDLAAHGIQNRTVALIENGSWAPTSGKQMRALLEGCKNMTWLEETVSIKSALKEEQAAQLEAMADAIAASLQ